MRNSIESILTRGISIISKFLLVGYLAKILTLQDYGSYQLISYFITISTTIFGLEYYNISHREIVRATDSRGIFKEHLGFFLTLSPLLIIVQITVFIILFPKELVTLRNISVVLFIGFCDYFSQEIFRYLMIKKAYRKGNLQLVYKSVFLLAIVGIYMLFNDTLVFEELLFLMIFSYFLLLIFARSSFIKHLYIIDWKDIKTLPLQKIKKIFLMVSPFIVLIFFIKGIEIFDKFIIGKVLGLEQAGIYSFLFSMASVLNVFVVSGFYIIYLPQLLEAFETGKENFKKTFKKFTLLTVGFSIIISLGILLISPMVFEIIGKLELLNHINLLYLLIISFILNNLSLIPHLFLYVCHKDKKITWIMGISFLLNLSLNLILIPHFGMTGAAYAFLLTYSCVLILKAITAIKLWRKEVA